MTMISNYRTQGTTAYSFLRRSFVHDSCAAALSGGKQGMILRVDSLANLQLLGKDWINGIASAIGLSLFVDGSAYEGSPISEHSRCWSHGKRLRLGRFRT